MKHKNSKGKIYVRGDASSPGGDASPRRHCQIGVRCPNLAIHEYQHFMYLLAKA